MGFFTEDTDPNILFMYYWMPVFSNLDCLKMRHVWAHFNIITRERLIIFNERSSDTNMILV